MRDCGNCGIVTISHSRNGSAGWRACPHLRRHQAAAVRSLDKNRPSESAGVDESRPAVPCEAHPAAIHGTRLVVPSVRQATDSRRFLSSPPDDSCRLCNGCRPTPLRRHGPSAHREPRRPFVFSSLMSFSGDHILCGAPGTSAWIARTRRPDCMRVACAWKVPPWHGRHPGQHPCSRPKMTGRPKGQKEVQDSGRHRRSVRDETTGRSGGTSRPRCMWSADGRTGTSDPTMRIGDWVPVRRQSARNAVSLRGD